MGPQAKAPEEEVRGTANPLPPEMSGEHCHLIWTLLC